MLYYILRPIVRIALWFFYRPFKIKGLENIPKGVPVILAPNHQNSFLDAILPACFQPRTIHFLARSDVFKKGLVENILYSIKMWPVYRQRDGKDSLDKNEEIFRRCSELLRNNGCLLLFPEGDQVCAHKLRTLKKGMARIAFQAAEESGFQKEIYIVPLGLNYEHFWNFDTALEMRFGKPVKVLDFAADYQENDQKGLNVLTQAVSDRLREEIIHIDDPADEKFWFEEAGLSGDDLTSPAYFKNLDLKMRPASKKKKSGINALGRLLHWPALTLINNVLKSKIRDVKFLGSVKFGLGLVLFPLYYAMVAGIVSGLSGVWWSGPAAVVVMAVSLKVKRG